MFLAKNKLTASIISLTALISVFIIPPFVLLILSACIMSAKLFNYINSAYPIDYKYAISFISQLVGLILIVASFVSVFVLVSQSFS